jgi:class 3 adenylate cyclase
MLAAVQEASRLTDTAMIRAVLTTAQLVHMPLDPSHRHDERSSQGGVRLWAALEVTLTLPPEFSPTHT